MTRATGQRGDVVQTSREIGSLFYQISPRDGQICVELVAYIFPVRLNHGTRTYFTRESQMSRLAAAVGRRSVPSKRNGAA